VKIFGILSRFKDKFFNNLFITEMWLWFTYLNMSHFRTCATRLKSGFLKLSIEITPEYPRTRSISERSKEENKINWKRKKSFTNLPRRSLYVIFTCTN